MGTNRVTILAKGALLFSAFMMILLFSAPPCAADNTGEDICVRRESLCTMLQDQGFTVEDIRVIFSDERIVLYPGILEKKGKGLNYFNRKFGLLTRKSVERGRKILKENNALFKAILGRYNVEPEVLVSVYRVETNFGHYVGHYPVFNSLLTMTLMENRRSGWAEKELVSLLVLTRSNKTDPLSVKGSWAGAFGLCQFVPSSYLNYGADGNDDGIVDLFRFADAMASVANYLKEHGWETGDTEKERKAIWSYNHCDNYVDAVLAYAKALKKKTGRVSRRRSS